MITVKQAKRLEDSFLGGITEAQDAYEQIVAEEAWTVLGYDTFTDWWSDRVAPLMRQLSMYPNKRLTASADELIRKEDESLPPAQRRGERERAEIIGVTRDQLRDRPPRSTYGGNPPPSEQPAAEPADPLPAPIAEQIGQRIAERVTRPTAPPIQPPDLDVRERLAREREEQQMRELHSGHLAKSVWLLAQYGADVDAADNFAKDWQPSQDIYPMKTTAARLRAAGDFLYALAERWPQ